MRRRVGRRGHALFDDQGVDSVFGEQQCGSLAGPAPTIRTREVLTSLAGCAEFEGAQRRLHHGPAAGLHHLARHQRLRGSIVVALPPAIAGVYISS
jgi:hypothetical protein